jgi:hypothetical protein
VPNPFREEVESVVTCGAVGVLAATEFSPTLDSIETVLDLLLIKVCVKKLNILRAIHRARVRIYRKHTAKTLGEKLLKT